MIDKSIRQYYADGQLTKKGDPFYKDEEFQTFQQPTRNRDRSDYKYEGPVQSGYTNVGVIGYPGDEKHEGNLTFKKDFRGNVLSDTGVSQLYKTPRKIKEQVYEAQQSDSLKGTTVEALQKGREQARAQDYAGDATAENIAAQLPPEKKSMLNKLTDKLTKDYVGEEGLTLKSAATGAGKNFITKAITKKLAGTSILAALGPIGWLIGGWLARKAVSKFTGEETGDGIMDAVTGKLTGRDRVKDTDGRYIDFQDPDFGVGSKGKVSGAGIRYDKEHGAGAYKEKTIRNQISNIVESGSTSDIAIDKINRLAKELPFEHEGAITTTPPPRPTVEDTAAMEDIITAPPPKPPPVYHAPIAGGGGNGGGGGGSYSGDPGGGTAGSPFFRGGRIDKTLTGRSRDI